MEKLNNLALHLERKSIKGYKHGSTTQRMSYDLTHQDKESITELNSALKHFSARSRGEFKYWITGDFTASSDDPECKEIAAEFEENFK